MQINANIVQNLYNKKYAYDLWPCKEIDDGFFLELNGPQKNYLKQIFTVNFYRYMFWNHVDAEFGPSLICLNPPERR